MPDYLVHIGTPQLTLNEMYSQSGRAMDHVHHEQARHSSRGSLVRAKAGKVAFVMRMSIGVIMRMLMGGSDHANADTDDE